ncbi:unnamed protein product [Mytilus edulis]|uniref:Uncharacterized protein n=1 Tax=Mytilus edulis TaxID=6550 RepID=A0A8S3TAE6_MYTED|nr:unnamed protein product [Mytilus edulis]
MMDEDSKMENEQNSENVSHSEMRAILWGRQLSRSQSEPQRVSEFTEHGTGFGKMKRPTSLSDEWKELQKIKMNKNPITETLLPQTQHFQSRRSIWKNFLSLCGGLMLAFMSFLPLRNIQSSIYPIDNLGTICLSSMYAAFIVGCTISPWLVQNARPKGLILLAVASHVFYVAANLYPSYMTLIPASVIFGFLQAPLWSVQELLIGSYGSSYSAITGIRVDKSIRQFQSVFVIFCHCAQILGNLIESLVLNYGTVENMHTLNKTHFNLNHLNCTENCVGKFGYHMKRPNEIEEPVDYLEILKFIYLAFSCFAMILIGFCLRKPDIILNKRKMSLLEKLGDVLSFFRTKSCAMIGLLMVFTGMQQAVVISDVTMVYGTEKLGLSIVGYMMMCYGTCQLATLLLLERMQRRFRPIVFILKGFLITLGLLILLYVWEPRDNSVLTIFGFMALWGATDAIWQSQIQNILITSTTKRESAVVCFRICQGFGLTVVFLSSLWLSLLYKVCMVGATLVFGVMGYMLLEVTNNPVTPLDPEPFSL